MSLWKIVDKNIYNSLKSKKKRTELKELRDNCSKTSMLHLTIDESCLLKSIEEELGIKLTTLFVALDNGIWCNNTYYRSVFLTKTTEGYMLFDFTNMAVFTKDYGKTWALTNEELE